MDGPNKRKPIIAVTANAMRGDREKCIAKVPACMSICVALRVSVCLRLCLCVCVCVVSLHRSTSISLSLSRPSFSFSPSVLPCYISLFLSVCLLSLSLSLSLSACIIGKNVKFVRQCSCDLLKEYSKFDFFLSSSPFPFLSPAQGMDDYIKARG